jgi:ADP-heptose:LPS heptosyltransferase
MKTFFKNLLILAACYYLYFVHIFHKKRSIGKRPKILIIQLAKLGDMVCTTPMFRAIKKIYPEARITVVGNITNKDLLAGNPDIDNYITWAKNKPFSIIEDLKKEKFDFACITAPNFEALSALLLSHIPLIVVPKIESGYSPYETRSYKRS